MAMQRELIDRNKYKALLNQKSDREIIMDVALMQFDQCLMCEDHENRLRALERRDNKRFAVAGSVGAAIGTGIGTAVVTIINFFKGN